MMNRDPHETGIRSKPFAKNEDDEQFLQRLNQWLHDAPIPEPPTSHHVDKLPLIYVVGAPRSGTTLLYQLICRYLPVGYINNVIGRFWLRPSVGIRLSRAILGDQGREMITFHSKHGVSEGIGGPHEFGYFWRHWLTLDQSPTHHLSSTDLEKIDQAGLKRTLEREILASFEAPVAFKNVICGFHASFLTRLHPASVFVYITRDTFATAASILNARKERYGSYSTWWSLKPSTYPFTAASEDAAAEVIRQITDCRSEMEQEISGPTVSSCSVAYERLCSTPMEVLHAICGKVEECGISFRPILGEVPQLTASTAPSLPQELDRKLREGLEKIARA